MLLSGLHLYSFVFPLSLSPSYIIYILHLNLFSPPLLLRLLSTILSPVPLLVAPFLPLTLQATRLTMVTNGSDCLTSLLTLPWFRTFDHASFARLKTSIAFSLPSSSPLDGKGLFHIPPWRVCLLPNQTLRSMRSPDMGLLPNLIPVWQKLVCLKFIQNCLYAKVRHR